MITIVFVKNPFEPDKDRSIKQVECSGEVLESYIAEYRTLLPDQELHIQVDGTIVKHPDQWLVMDGAFITVHPVVGKGGKSILGLVAMVALSVVSFGVGGLASNVGWTAIGTTAGWTTAGYLAAAGMMLIGGTLLSRFMSPKVSLGKFNNSTEDPTYSWNGITTMDGQGNAVAITYGKVKSGGQSIAKFITNNNNDQVLNWMVCAGEGPLTISNVSLNDNPIENYKDVTVDIRPGTNNQEIINNFNDVITPRALGYEILNNEYRTDVIPGNTTEGIIIDVEFSQGLYHANDDGNLSTAWVDINADYALRGSGEWKPLVTSYTIVKPNPVNAELIDGSAELGNWKIRVQRVKSETTDSDGDTIKQIYWRIRVGKPSAKDVWIFAGTFGWYSGSFSPGETGSINVGPFRFDKQTMQAKGDGYSTTAEVTKNGRVSAAQSTAVRRSFRIDNIPAGEYEVRVTVIGRSAATNSTRDGVKCWWTTVSSVIYDDFIYPNKALIGLKALATNQLSGSAPNLTFIKERATVLVYNPSVGYQEKDATNPAWAAYDYCHGARLLEDPRTGQNVIDVRGVPAELMMYDRFEEWAEHCDKMNLKINIEMATVGEFWQQVNTDIAPVGRGKIVQFGTRFGCIWDHVSQPVQMFTMGNIVTGSFKQTWLGTKDRANAIELTFNNAAKDYERDTMTCYGDNYDEPGIIPKTTQIQINGITSWDQAYREAKYQLKCNELLLQSVEFSAEIDAIGCMVGDQILVAHDVPQWSHSGRIYQNNGLYVVTLAIDPDTVDMTLDYQFQYRSINDNLHSRKVSSIDVVGRMVSVTVETGFDAADPPQVHDIFALGPVERTCKPFIVTSISRNGEYQRQITALEYNAAIFDENYEIPMPDYSLDTDNDAQNVINLQARQVAYKNKQGTLCCRMFVSWQLPDGAKADYFTVLLSDNYGSTWKVSASVYGMECELDTQPFTEYMVKVITVLKLRQSTGTIVGPVAAGIDELPPDVTTLDHEELSSGTRRFWWTFEYPNPNDIAGFKIKYIQGNSLNWNAAYELHSGFITLQPFETQALRQGVHTVMIKAVDNAGQESQGMSYCVLNLGDPLEDNVLYKEDFASDQWSKVVTNGVILDDGYIHAPQSSYFWGYPECEFWVQPDWAFWREQYNAFYLNAQLVVPASGQFWLRYDISGPAAIEYRITGKNNFWDSPDAPFWDEEDWAFWPDETVLFKPYTCKVQVKAGDVIQIRVLAPSNTTEESILRSLVMIVDVPDREEHFENLEVPIEGISLEIQTPHYYTAAVRIDAVQDYSGSVTIARAAVISRNPCRIKLLDINNNPVAGIVDVTWQGFVKEVL